VKPKRPGQESCLSRAIFADGELWLLSDAGQLSSITEGEGIRVEPSLPEPVLDLCLHNGTPTIVTREQGREENWTLRRWAAGKWSVIATVREERDELVALSCVAGELLLVTNRRLIDVGSNQHAVALSGQLTPGRDPVASVENLREKLLASIKAVEWGGGLWRSPPGLGVVSVHSTRDHVFVGINAGEWGGGLLRIDRRTGKLSRVVGNPDDLRGGSIHNDPITGIAPIPWKAGCVAVAIGVVHFVPRGRIMEVCGDDVRRLYFKGLPHPDDEGKVGEPFTSVAFFGLTSLGDALWAVGVDGIYRLEPGGAVHSVPLPEFMEVDGIRVSFDLPQFVVVMTDINQRCSLSGSVPLLVPR
jgi:hypothetical protein